MDIPSLKNDLLFEALNHIIPYEPEPPKAEFDCEPTLKNKYGELRYDWTAHIRRQFKQDEINLQWKERQRIREKFIQYNKNFLATQDN
jgi:hypothetical protein